MFDPDLTDEQVAALAAIRAEADEVDATFAPLDLAADTGTGHPDTVAGDYADDDPADRPGWSGLEEVGR